MNPNAADLDGARSAEWAEWADSTPHGAMLPWIAE